MNTVGKTLVILNFLFAIGVGAFLVVDFATRTNWKTEVEKRDKQIQVLVAERKQYAEDSSQSRGNNKEQVLANEQLRNERADQEAKHKAELIERDAKVTDAQMKAQAADVNLQKAIADVGRLKESELTLKGVISEREKAILDLQDQVKKFRTEAVANEALANQLQDRNKELLDQLQKVSVELARQKAFTSTGGGTEGPRIEARYNDANPPGNMVKGKIEKVDAKDSTLVQISVGTDLGVNKNNTMEVFRTTPAPKYLGMVRIVDASPHHSVGRLIVPPGVSRPQLREGDLVWSRLR